MAWGFMDWVRGRPRPDDPGALTLPERPLDEDLRKLLPFLLDERRATEASRLLEPHRDRATPILEGLFRTDERFRSREGTISYYGMSAFEATLKILMEWKSEVAVREVLALAGCAETPLRARAARLLGSTGDARFRDALVRLSRDPDEGVRRAVGLGISDILDASEYSGRSIDDALALGLYDFMRDCALRTDRGPGNGFAKVMLGIDRERATRDLNPGALTIDRNWLRDILEALHEAGIDVPRERLSALLDEAVTMLDRPDFDEMKRFSIDDLVAELIVQLARHDPAAARARLAALRSHPRKKARQAAQRARERLVPDPMKAVGRAYEAAGGFDGLRHEHRVAWLVSMFDAELSNGGWLQWLANTDGPLLVATEAALREVGADRAAEEVRVALATLGPDGRSTDQRRRMKAIDRMMNAGRSLPDDSVIWNMDLRSLIYDYAERNPAVFRS